MLNRPLQPERTFSSPFGRSASEAVLLRNKSRDCTYFIQAGDDGPIKIGWAANVRKRLSELQPGNPYPLFLLGTILVGQAKERELHRKFSHLRMFGEWFSPGVDLLSFIAQECREFQEGGMS